MTTILIAWLFLAALITLTCLGGCRKGTPMNLTYQQEKLLRDLGNQQMSVGPYYPAARQLVRKGFAHWVEVQGKFGPRTKLEITEEGRRKIQQ